MFRIPLAHNVGRGQIDSMTKPISLGTARIAISMLLLAGATLPVAAGFISHIPFGTTKDGKEVQLYTLRNSHGMTVKVMTYGAVIYSLEVPDRHGKLANITAGLSEDKAQGRQTPGQLAKQSREDRSDQRGLTGPVLAYNGDQSPT